jgi:hypothetical protein
VANLMINGDRTILLGLGRFSWGQPEWDLAQVATEHLTTGRWSDAEYATFTEAYGWDVTTWDGFPTLRAITEIDLATRIS